MGKKGSRLLFPPQQLLTTSYSPPRAQKLTRSQLHKLYASENVCHYRRGFFRLDIKRREGPRGRERRASHTRTHSQSVGRLGAGGGERGTTTAATRKLFRQQSIGRFFALPRARLPLSLPLLCPTTSAHTHHHHRDPRRFSISPT